MSITSPMRPDEVPNPDGLDDDLAPGVDLDADTVRELAFYVRALELPARPDPDSHGEDLFGQVWCDRCHVPTLHTRADYPIEALADIEAQSTPTCCCTTWATTSPTASPRAVHRTASGGPPPSSACAT